MGEVDDLQDAENEGQADRHQRVEHADDQSVDQEIEGQHGNAATTAAAGDKAGDAGFGFSRIRRLRLIHFDFSMRETSSGLPGSWTSFVSAIDCFTAVTWKVT